MDIMRIVDVPPRLLRNPYLAALVEAETYTYVTGAVESTYDDGRGNVATYVRKPEQAS